MASPFTTEERDFLLKLIADVRFNPLDPNAATLIQTLQAIGKKVTELSLALPAQPVTPAKQKGQKAQAVDGGATF